ncbi:MAG: cytochrome c3 family protein [Anaerosomatales bacterium]|nr:cytochrome c3 family protein [Anaerosomatales bacterium]
MSLAVAVAATLFAGASTLFAAGPASPQATAITSLSARVSQGSAVRVTWVLAGAEPGLFELHRSAWPMDPGDVDASTLVTVAPAGTRALTVASDAAEVDGGFQEYYTIRWVTGEDSGLSRSMSPNPHGAALADTVRSCEVCHGAHGAPGGASALGAAGTGTCYGCHGATEGTRAHGAGATADVQAAFYDETSTPLPEGGSRHRTAFMVANGGECTACHTPHRRPYAGVTEPGFPRLLRTRDSGGGDWVFGTDAVPLGNELCFGCHGADDALMADTGGPGAHVSAGGDHETGYAGSAHSAANVPGTIGAATQCQVCHDEHASPVAGLIDYRGSGIAESDNAESGLCFKCHSAQAFKGVEEDRGPGKPYTWNGRDVWSQFTSTSSHPYLSSGGGYAAKSRTELTVASKAAFDALERIDVSVYPGDDYAGYPDYAALRYSSSVERDYAPLDLGYINGMIVGYDAPGFQTFDTGAVNAKGFNPPAPAAPGSGSTSLEIDGTIYVTRGESGGTGTTDRWAYVPPAGSGDGELTTASPTPSPVGTGADSDVDTVNGVAFFSAGEGSSEIMKWRYGVDTWAGSIRFAVGGVETGLGIGSTIAYSPQADRLFVVNRDGTSGDGVLYYLDAPSTASGLTDFASTGLQVTISSASAVRHNRMARVQASGDDYLYIVGTSAANAGRTQLVSALTTTPVLQEAPGFPFTWGYYQLDDGCALEWDGEGTLYAIQGGGRPDLSWRAVPSDPVADVGTYRWWNEWGYYNDWYSYPVGTSLAFAWTDPGPFLGSGYVGEGSIVTGSFAPDESVYRLGEIAWTGSSPADTSVRFDLQGFSAGTWSDIAGYTDMAGPANLRDIDIEGWDAFRVVTQLYSPMHNSTPLVYSITVTSEYESFTPGGSLTCVNCHNVHLAEKGSGVWDLARVADPDDTRSGFTGTTTAFCLTCHDGTAPEATAAMGAFVPYSVSFSDMSGYPAFEGWDKTVAGADFMSSAHATTSGVRALCETCHDPHGSDNRSLLAWTRPAGFVAGTAGERDNSSSAATGSNLCFQCHGNGVLGTAAPGAPDIATSVSLARGHNVGDYIGRHDDRETMPSATDRHIECADCHDPHAARAGTHTLGTSEAGPALQGATGAAPTWSSARWTTAVSWEVTRVIGEGGLEAYVCMRCHGKTSMGIRFTVPSDPTLGGSSTFSYYETDLAREFNPANQSGHNIVGSQSDWPKEGAADGLAYSWPFPSDAAAFRSGTGLTKDSRLTCTDCHTSEAGGAVGPHGSQYPFGLVADGVYDSFSGTYKRWYETRLEEWNDEFLCGRCHVMGSNNVHRLSATLQYNNHRYFTCASCHVSIPHGWQLPRLLREDAVLELSPYIRSTRHIIDPDNSSYVWSGDLDEFSAEPHTPTGWQSSDCAAYCHVHNARHESPWQITPWSP